MSIVLDSLEEFELALREVKALIDIARPLEEPLEETDAAHEDSFIYSACKKSALLLLTSKFEAFLENILEDYIAKINAMQVSSKKLPEDLLFQHTLLQIEKINKIKSHKHKHSKVKELLIEMSKPWILDEIHLNLEIESKFSYGKHGEKEFIKLFEKIGISDIFSEIIVYKDQESLLNQEDSLVVDIKATVNSITVLRNNIIHGDASPSFGIQSVEDYTKELRLFAENLTEFLENSIRSILE